MARKIFDAKELLEKHAVVNAEANELWANICENKDGKKAEWKGLYTAKINELEKINRQLRGR